MRLQPIFRKRGQNQRPAYPGNQTKFFPDLPSEKCERKFLALTRTKGPARTAPGRQKKRDLSSKKPAWQAPEKELK
jgi:hypothetical protein